MNETIQELNNRFINLMIKEGFLDDKNYKKVEISAGVNQMLTIKAEWLEDGEINGVFDDEIKLVEGHQIGDVYKFIHSGDICDLIDLTGLKVTQERISQMVQTVRFVILAKTIF